MCICSQTSSQTPGYQEDTSSCTETYTDTEPRVQTVRAGPSRTYKDRCASVLTLHLPTPHGYSDCHTQPAETRSPTFSKTHVPNSQTQLSSLCMSSPC